MLYEIFKLTNNTNLNRFLSCIFICVQCIIISAVKQRILNTVALLLCYLAFCLKLVFEETFLSTSCLVWGVDVIDLLDVPGCVLLHRLELGSEGGAPLLTRF